MVTSALCGARAIHEIEDSAKAGDIEISQEDQDTIQKLLDERQKVIPPPPVMGGGPPGGKKD